MGTNIGTWKLKQVCKAEQQVMECLKQHPVCHIFAFVSQIFIKLLFGYQISILAKLIP